MIYRFKDISAGIKEQKQCFLYVY